MKIERHVIQENYWEVAVQRDNMWKGISVHEDEGEAIAKAWELKKEDDKVTVWAVITKTKREMVPYQ